MKKWLILALSLLMLCSATACGGMENDTKTEDQTAQLQAEIDRLTAENEDLRARLDAAEAPAAPEASADGAVSETNPIDAFYDSIDTTNMNTIEMNTVAMCRANSWAEELNHLGEVIKAALPLQEDRDLVDAYITAANGEQLDRMSIMTLFVCSDLYTPQEDRVMTAGTLRGVLWGENAARVNRDAFYELRQVDPASYWEGGYEFAFDEAEAQVHLDGMMPES